MIRLKPKYRRLPQSKRSVPSKESLSSSRFEPIRLLFVIFLGVCVAMLLVTIYLNYENAVRNLKRLRHTLHKSNVSESVQYIIDTKKCRVVDYKFNDTFIMDVYFSSKPTTCNQTAKPFVFEYEMNLTKGSSCVTLNEELFAKHYSQDAGSIHEWKCTYQEPSRGVGNRRVDQSLKWGPHQKLFVGSCPPEEFLWITCTFRNGSTYEQPLALPVVKPVIRPVVPNNRGKKPFHVLLLGYDSISRLNSYRQLPKTVAFLRTKPNLVELYGYNKIGLNSAPNQIALLTGIRYLEPGLNSRVKGQYFDNLTRYLWQDFELRGFRTMFYEEQWMFGLFVYPPLIGFEMTQTTYWPRPWMQAIDGSLMKKQGRHCIGPNYPGKYYLKYTADTLQILGPDRPMFAYGWLSELPHDDVNGGQRLDEDLFRFFENLDRTGVLDNTAVFFISDHGMRFGSFRQTVQGKLEDMMPFGYVLMPQRFFDVYPEAAKNLRINSKRLVTVYDLYTSMLELGDVWEDKRVTKTARGFSLFSTVIPDDRTCADAGIDFQFCSCYVYEALDRNSAKALSLSRTAMQKLNAQVERANLSQVCRVWALKYVKDFGQLSEGNEVTNYYRLTVRTVPNADFEIVAELGKNSWELVVPIDRTSYYSDTSHCVEDGQMKKYCYCIK